MQLYNLLKREAMAVVRTGPPPYPIERILESHYRFQPFPIPSLWENL